MTHSKKAIDFLHAGDIVGMHAELAKAINSDNHETLYDLAEYLNMMGFVDESRQVFEALTAKGMDDSGILMNLAEMAMMDNDLDTALDYLFAIPENDDNYVAALVSIADVYQMDGLPEVALEKLEEAKALSDSPLITFAIAELHFSLGDWQAAIDNYGTLSQREILAQTKISTYQRIGSAYASMGDFENAIPFLEKSLELDHDDTVLFDIALIYLQMGENLKAIDYFKQLDAINSDFEGYERYYGEALVNENRFEEALDVAKAGLAKNPQNTSLLHFASRIAYALHDFEGAESYLMQAMDVPDAYDETIFLLSNLYLDHEEIDGVINLAPQIEDDNYLAKWNLARAYQIKEEDDKALQIYDDIYTYLFDDVEFVLAYIDALTNAGRRQEARDIAENFIQQVEFDDRIQSKLIGLMED